MSILSSFKKALGFPDEYDDELEEMEDFEDSKDERPASITNAAANQNSCEGKEDTPETEMSPIESDTTDNIHQPADNGLPGEMFDSVIELFNATQPDFVRDCLSIESQRTYILDRMDKALRGRLQSEVDKARARGEKQWNIEKQKMNNDIEKLKSEYYSLKQQREEFQSAQLSAARQKRALSERIHDLEIQVKTLEAEKEQFQLENRSMVNKLRAANVRTSTDGDTEAELQRIAEENVKLQDQIKSLTTDNDSSAKRISQLEEELKKQSEKSESDETQQKAIAEIEAQITQFESIKARKDKKISELSNQNRKANTDIAALRDKLTEAVKERDSLMEQTESLSKKLTEEHSSNASTIESLRSEIKRLTELINAGANDSPRKSKPGRKNKKSFNEQAKTVDKADNETKDTAEEIKAEEKSEEPQASTIKISAIDELMDSTDWFIAPEPVPLKKDPEVEEEFGYKEPPRKPSHDNDKQLSLW